MTKAAYLRSVDCGVHIRDHKPRVQCCVDGRRPRRDCDVHGAGRRHSPRLERQGEGVLVERVVAVRARLRSATYHPRTVTVNDSTYVSERFLTVNVVDFARPSSCASARPSGVSPSLSPPSLASSSSESDGVRTYSFSLTSGTVTIKHTAQWHNGNTAPTHEK